MGLIIPIEILKASVELGNWLCGNCNNEDMLRRKWVLELGCGCGLLATAVSKTFPHLSKYYASDGSSSAVSKCKTNVEANFGNLKSDVIQVEEIDWQRDGEKFKKVVTKLSEEFEGPGLLLGAGRDNFEVFGFITNKIYTAPLALE